VQTIDRRQFNAGLFLGLGLTRCAHGGPDLVVTALRWSENDGATWHTGPIQAGSDVWFEADVKNQGTGSTPAGVITGVAFRVNGTLVAWSDDHTQSIPAGATRSLRANGGPDGDRYWNDTQGGSYTIRVQVDDGNLIPGESDETNNALDVPVTVGSAATVSATVGAVSGAGNISKSEAGSHKIADLAALHCGLARVSCHPKNDYFQGDAASPAKMDEVVVALLQNGVQPYFSFVFTDDLSSAETGIPERNYADWFEIGQAFASRFKKGSSFLVGQGITDLGAYGYAAINEPDHGGGETPGLTHAQYHDMLQGLADGVHSSDPDGKVWPAGYLSGNRDQEYTGHGYCLAVADLINDGTLEGFDLHTYHSKNGAQIHDTYDRSHQHDADQFVVQCGITRQDIDIICTETNIRGDPDATSQGYDEATARNWFLTSIFDVWGTLRPDGTLAQGPRFPWQLWMQGNPVWYMAEQLEPRVERWCGHTYKMLLDLLWDMRFTFNDPKGTGVHKLSGGGKSAWVFQNIHSSWSTLFGDTFTIDDIPAAATRVDVYDGMGLIETVDNPGPNHVFPTPTGKSYLLIADAETPP
jgi:hypothetical protein